MTTYVGNAPQSGAVILGQMPIGGIIAWGNATLPAGWIECNGQSTSPFPELAGIYGATVPDLRGEFIRGFDNGKGTDTGRVLGSSQVDAFESHGHNTNMRSSEIGGSADATGAYITPHALVGARGADSSNITDTTIVDSFGGTETRPLNVALIYIIKAYMADTTPMALGILAPNKNYIINPTFSVNQRVFAGGAPYGYCFDRWKTSDVTTTVTMPDANGFVTIALATGTVGLQHRPEDFGYSGNITISWEGTSELIFRDNGGSWSTATTSPAVINMATGLDATGAKALIVFQNGTLKNPKLEIGSSATPFEYPDDASELIKCRRYYNKSYDLNTAPASVTNVGALTIRTAAAGSPSMIGMQVQFPQMARIPTIVWYSTTTGTANRIRNMSSTTDLTVSSSNYAGESSTGFPVVTIAQASAQFIEGQYTADAEL